MSSEQDIIQSTLLIEIIRLAHQIHTFIQSGHSRPQQDFAQLVKSVVEDNSLPQNEPTLNQQRQTRSSTTLQISQSSGPFLPN